MSSHQQALYKVLQHIRAFTAPFTDYMHLTAFRFVPSALLFPTVKCGKDSYSRNMVFWYVTLHRWIDNFRRFEETYRLQFQGLKVHFTMGGDTSARNVGKHLPSDAAIPGDRTFLLRLCENASALDTSAAPASENARLWSIQVNCPGPKGMTVGIGYRIPMSGRASVQG
jgi:hypothetical protein